MTAAGDRICSIWVLGDLSGLLRQLRDAPAR
jgi:hypothetical protein